MSKKQGYSSCQFSDEFNFKYNILKEMNSVMNSVKMKSNSTNKKLVPTVILNSTRQLGLQVVGIENITVATKSKKDLAGFIHQYGLSRVLLKGRSFSSKEQPFQDELNKQMDCPDEKGRDGRRSYRGQASPVWITELFTQLLNRDVRSWLFVGPSAATEAGLCQIAATALGRSHVVVSLKDPQFTKKKIHDLLQADPYQVVILNGLDQATTEVQAELLDILQLQRLALLEPTVRQMTHPKVISEIIPEGVQEWAFSETSLREARFLATCSESSPKERQDRTFQSLVESFGSVVKVKPSTQEDWKAALKKTLNQELKRVGNQANVIFTLNKKASFIVEAMKMYSVNSSYWQVLEIVSHVVGKGLGQIIPNTLRQTPKTLATERIEIHWDRNDLLLNHWKIPLVRPVPPPVPHLRTKQVALTLGNSLVGRQYRFGV
jgi:hypothetical protein